MSFVAEMIRSQIETALAHPEVSLSSQIEDGVRQIVIAYPDDRVLTENDLSALNDLWVSID